MTTRNRAFQWDCVRRHNQEHTKHEGVAKELEAARQEFQEFERKDIKVPLAA